MKLPGRMKREKDERRWMDGGLALWRAAIAWRITSTVCIVNESSNDLLMH